jgi:hypothetical protein
MSVGNGRIFVGLVFVLMVVTVVPVLSFAGGLTVKGDNVGIGTTSPIYPLQVNTDSGYAIYGYSAIDNGVVGSSSAASGVFGTSANGNGVYGVSSNNNGVMGSSSSGYGIYGQSTSGYAGYFDGRVNVNGNQTVDGGVTVSGNITAPTGIVTAASFSGSGSGLTGIPGGQVTGTVASATNANTLEGQSASDIINAASDEVRTPISDCGTTISTSGSYYVTQNLSAASGDCIDITASDVTIELNGFALTGVNASNTYGIYINNASNIEVRNGTVKNFYTGIYGSNNPQNIRAINIRAISNTYAGFLLSTSHGLIKDCIASYNGYGILGNNSLGVMVIGNSVYHNDIGIFTGNGETITGNTVTLSQYAGIELNGNSTATGNTVFYNNNSNNATNAGIVLYGSQNVLKGNTIGYNNQTNIIVEAVGNDIEENFIIAAYGTSNGILFTTSGNFYANNRATGNTTNYNLSGHTETDGGGNVGF